MKATYELRDKMGRGDVKATLTIDAPTITDAEQNIVIMDGPAEPIAVVLLQPGIDRRQI
jgi:hypothetical protein